MSFLEWRKFNFFELRKNIDDGKVAEALVDTSIEICSSGYSQLVIGDSKGWVHIFSRAWKVTSFKAYEHAIIQIVQLLHDPFIVTIGEDELGIKSVLKVWDGSRQDAQGRPTCIRNTKLSRMRAGSTCLTIHDNKNLMAVGFDDGSVTLFRGDITRQRSSKEIDLRSKPNDATSITGLAFKGTTHLFVASRSSVMVYTIGSSGKERGVIMDEGASGCRPHCAVLVHDQQFVVAKNDAIYCYTTDGRGPCYALEGIKKRVDWFRSYLVTISKENSSKASPSDEDSSSSDQITILDIQNKFIVFSMILDEVKAVITEWGAFYVITEDKQVHHLDEKDLQSKLSLLFKKNLYDVAIRIASSQKYDSERLIDIYTQYGDHLFKKGDPKGAVEQYVKTIGRLETSYVIRKYLESRHLEPLTYYLQELHKMGLATEDHTTLLLTCFVKLDQHDQHGKLKEFINAKDRVIDFDIEIAIKVCRQVSSDDALHLAKKHNQHDWYLRIITEDKKDFLAAIDYIADMEFDVVDVYMKKYGNVLMQHVPAETTQFLKLLCIDYKPRNKPLVDDAMMAGVVSRNQINRARPEEYIHLFLNNSERLVEFLEHLVKCETGWSKLIYNTLIEHHLHVWSSLKDKSNLRETYEQKIVKLLQSSEANYDKDQTLIVCLMKNFKPGILYLYEEYKLYQQILRYHISQNDMDAAMNCCLKFGGQEPHLWVELLWSAPPPIHLPEVLNVIANQRLLSPLLVIECLTSSKTYTLGDVRKYLMSILNTEEEISSKAAAQGEQLRKEAEQVRNELRDAVSKPMVCQASRCAACSRTLDLPARHFLCGHSYHQHCFQSFSENEEECPACVPNNKKLMEVLRNQGTSAHTTEAFHSQLEKANDGFSVVAEYFGRGIFNKLTIITEDDTISDGKTATSKLESFGSSSSLSLNNKATKLVRPETLNYGPGAEARLRLEEGVSKQGFSLENQRPTAPKSGIIIPIPEARVRLMEQPRQETQYSSSLEANITHYPTIDTAKPSTSNIVVLSIEYGESSRNTTPAKNSPASLKNKKIDKISLNIDNASTGSASSLRDKSHSSKSNLNPFEDDDDDNKNPFANDDDAEPTVDKKNPFEDDADDADDESSNTNPFA